MAMQQAIEAGFVPMIPPVLVKPEAMEGTGFLGAHASEVYHLPEDDLYLVGTSEVPLAAYHVDEILDGSALPYRYAGWSSCFRREAGSYGKDTRGIIRVHQFDKVEMFSYCRPEDAHEEHRRLLDWEKEMLAKVELPYRVIDTAAGDLGILAPRASSTARRGSRPRAATASSPRPPTAPTSRPAASRVRFRDAGRQAAAPWPR